MYSIFCYIWLILMANLGYIYTIYTGQMDPMGNEFRNNCFDGNTTNFSANRLMVTLMVWAQTQFPALL